MNATTELKALGKRSQGSLGPLGVVVAVLLGGGLPAAAEEVRTLPPTVASGSSAAMSPEAGVDNGLREILRGAAARWEREAENTRLFLERYAFTHLKVTERWADDHTLKERQEQSLRHEPSAGPRAAEGRPERRSPGYRTDDFQEGEAVLARFDYRRVGREWVNGRATWVIDFTPRNLPVPARNLKERFINAAAGRVWIDTEDYVAARLDLHLVHQVKVVGGLVGNVRACQVRLERRRTPDGLWYTPRFEWHLEGRALLARKHLSHREEKTGVVRVR